MSHTPAPWEWDANPCDYDEEQDAPWLVAPNSAQVVLLGSIKCGSEADARLIASAPELLEALNELYKVVSEYEDLVCSEAPSTHRNAMDKARQTLAKAEGK